MFVAESVDVPLFHNKFPLELTDPVPVQNATLPLAPLPSGTVVGSTLAGNVFVPVIFAAVNEVSPDPLPVSVVALIVPFNVITFVVLFHFNSLSSPTELPVFQKAILLAVPEPESPPAALIVTVFPETPIDEMFVPAANIKSPLADVVPLVIDVTGVDQLKLPLVSTFRRYVPGLPIDEGKL